MIELINGSGFILSVIICILNLCYEDWFNAIICGIFAGLFFIVF